MHTQLLPLLHKMLGHSILLLTASALATIDFTSQITLGSIVISVVIIAIAGIFTIRSKIANIWREEAEGERAAKERLQEELIEERTDRAEFEKQQQELRHELKDQIAGLRTQLKVMEAKTDLTVALDAIRGISEQGTSTSRALLETLTAMSDKSEQRDTRTHLLLEEIRDKLPNEPIAVVPADDTRTI